MRRREEDDPQNAERHERGIFERPKGSGIWWVCYFDEKRRKHREKVGPKGLARAKVALAIHTGLRRGEQFGLRWENLDFFAGSSQFRARRAALLGGYR